MLILSLEQEWRNMISLENVNVRVMCYLLTLLSRQTVFQPHKINNNPKPPEVLSEICFDVFTVFHLLKTGQTDNI